MSTLFAVLYSFHYTYLFRDVCNVHIPVYNDGIRGRVVLVAAGTVLQATTADQFVGEKNSPEIWIFASSLVRNQLW